MKSLNKKIFDDNIYLVDIAVKKFDYGFVEREDLYQAGLYGLYKAIKKNRNQETFKKYAMFYIFSEIKKELRENKLIILSKELLKIKKYIKHNQEKTITQIADELKTSEEKVKMVIADIGDLYYFSEDSELKEKTSNYKNSLYSYYIDKLDYMSKEVIMLKYFKNYTQSEIAKILNCSQSTISRIEKNALKILKSKITK